MRRRGPGSLRGTLAGLVVALAVVLAVLIVVAILGMVTTARDYRDGAQKALVRQNAANALLIDLLSAQSANRAYILLAQGPDLRAYTDARDRYPIEMARLREVLGDSPERSTRSADAVDRTAGLWFAEAVELIRLRRQGRRRGGRAAHQPGPLREPLQRLPRRAHPPGGGDRGRPRSRRSPTTTAAAASPSTRSSRPPCSRC